MAEDKAKNRGKPKRIREKQIITLETPLTIPQEQFCVEYSKSGRGAESYKKSYPNCTKTTTATAGASRLLTYVNIQKRLDELRIATESDSIASMKEIKEFWSNMLRNTESKDGDRLKASELLGKTYGAFLDRVENTTPTTINFVMEKVKRK